MSDLLKYQMVELAIKRNIDEGLWLPDTKIPPEKVLVEQFGVSLITIKKAITNLVEEGILENREGKRGAFVATELEEPPVSRSTLIGVVIDSVQEQFGSAILKGIENCLHKMGYHTILCDSGRDYTKVSDFLDSLRENELAGVILSPVITSDYRSRNLAIIEKINNLGCPYVLLDRSVKGITSNYVASDHVNSAMMITEELLAKGHRRILTFTSLDCTSMEERYLGYRTAFEDAKIPLIPELILDIDDNIDYAEAPEELEKIKNKIRGAGDFTAFYAMNTRLLRIGLPLLDEMGFLPGENIRIAVNDQDFFAELPHTEGILHTQQPSYETGTIAAEMLISLISERPNYKSQRILSDRLINANP